MFQDEPFRITLEKGKKYSFCQCGKSENALYCDGNHKGTGIEPHRMIAEEDKKVAICGCDCSQKKPYCDGAHRLLCTREK